MSNSILFLLVVVMDMLGTEFYACAYVKIQAAYAQTKHVGTL